MSVRTVKYGNREDLNSLAVEIGLITKLGAIFTEFTKLPNQHPLDKSEFCHHIHILQRHLMARMTRRDYPDLFPPK